MKESKFKEINLSIPSSLNHLKYVIAKVQESAADAGLDEVHRNISIPLLLSESVTNAIKHGNRFDKSKKVHLRIRYDNERFIIYVKDEGAGFPFDDIANPTHPENIYEEHGRGIFLISSITDEYCYNKKGNEIKMVLLIDKTLDSSDNL
jgi:serine/threonine-protein kinase RsbW